MKTGEKRAPVGDLRVEVGEENRIVYKEAMVKRMQ